MLYISVVFLLVWSGRGSVGKKIAGVFLDLNSVSVSSSLVIDLFFVCLAIVTIYYLPFTTLAETGKNRYPQVSWRASLLLKALLCAAYDFSRKVATDTRVVILQMQRL